jgi:hypothetical protein
MFLFESPENQLVLSDFHQTEAVMGIEVLDASSLRFPVCRSQGKFLLFLRKALSGPLGHTFFVPCEMPIRIGSMGMILFGNRLASNII